MEEANALVDNKEAAVGGLDDIIASFRELVGLWPQTHSVFKEGQLSLNLE